MPIGEQGQSIPAQAWELRPPAAADCRKPAHRPVRVAGLMGYVDPVGVKPGEVLRVHLTAPAAYEIAVARLGRSVLLRPEPDDEADRAEAEWLATLESATACRHDVYPGSYAWVDNAAIGRPCTVSAWVRVWHLPATVETSSWACIVSDMDYPERCNWALGIDADGHPVCYLGDGGQHDRVLVVLRQFIAAQPAGRMGPHRVHGGRHQGPVVGRRRHGGRRRRGGCQHRDAATWGGLGSYRRCCGERASRSLPRR